VTPAAGDARDAGVVAAAIDPGRGAILPAGALVLQRVACERGSDRIIVSAHGVRHAYLRAALARAGVPADFGELWP